MLSRWGVSMKGRSLSKIFAVGLVAAAITCPLARAQAKPEPSALKLKVGDVAPDFKLEYFDGKDDKEVSLSQYRGKSNVVLAFYIFAFTGG
jgi:thioredoxin-dependent peroxiredoxin